MSNRAAVSTSRRRLMIWGSHPAYANGAWIKIGRLSDITQIRRRLREGFVICLACPPGDAS